MGKKTHKTQEKLFDALCLLWAKLLSQNLRIKPWKYDKCPKTLL